MTRWIAVVASMMMVFSAYALADMAAGKEKAQQICMACHGMDGNSTNPIWPSLAGQHPKYLVDQMKAFKAGKLRYDPSMAPMMAPLTQEDMVNLAAFYAAQKKKIVGADEKNLKKGERLYRGGDIDKKIAACIACHGPNGEGNAQAGFPVLSGQQPAYIVKQLLDYKNNKRSTDMNEIMRDIAARMDKSDMEAVANYISGLH